MMKIKISYIKNKQEVCFLTYGYDPDIEKPDIIIPIEAKYSDNPCDKTNEIRVLIDLYKSSSDNKLKEAIKIRYRLLTGRDIEEDIKK